MATANDIITRAFKRAGILAAESALEADEIQDGLIMLNDMLSSWEPVHHLGFAPVDSVADEVRIPRYAEAAVKDSLAIHLCTEYSRPVSQALAASAQMSLSAMMTVNVDLSNVDMPSTLPYGSGNEASDGVDDATFFPQHNKANF
jgi:hypothetical protein